MKFRSFASAVIGALALSACATAPGPVEVTRFHRAETLAQLGQGTIFVETAPGMDDSSLALAPYKAAVAQQLAALGYREAPRDEASQVAQVQLTRATQAPASKRGPVSVGVGGSTGSYGSGLGVGIGINLGGGPKPQVDTKLGVMIRDKATGRALWEGRAELVAKEGSELADPDAGAKAMARALFSEFPGNSGETVAVGVK